MAASWRKETTEHGEGNRGSPTSGLLQGPRWRRVVGMVSGGQPRGQTDGPSVVPQLHTDGRGQQSRPLPLVLSGRLERKHGRALGEGLRSALVQAAPGTAGEAPRVTRTARKTRPAPAPPPHGRFGLDPWAWDGAALLSSLF